MTVTVLLDEVLGHHDEDRRALQLHLARDPDACDTEDCYPNTGYGGFDIDILRYWRRAGSDELERTEKMHTTYIPSDTRDLQAAGLAARLALPRWSCPERDGAWTMPDMGLLTEDPFRPASPAPGSASATSARRSAGSS